MMTMVLLSGVFVVYESVSVTLPEGWLWSLRGCTSWTVGTYPLHRCPTGRHEKRRLTSQEGTEDLFGEGH